MSGAWGRAIGTAALLGLALLVLGPATVAPTRYFVGSEWLDAHGTQWFYWWTETRLRGEDPGPLLFFPWGKDLYRHTGGNLLDAILAAPLRMLLGPPAGTNLFILLLLLGNAFGGLRIAQALGAGPTGRFGAAALALLNPFVLFELQQGRPTQALLLFPSLLVASLLRPAALKEGIKGGLALAGCGLTYWYYGFVGGLVVAAVALVRLVHPGQRGSRPAEILRLGLVTALSLLLVAPFVLPMLQDLEAGEVPGLLALADEPGPLGRLRLRTVEGDEQGLFVLGLSGRGGALVETDGLRFDPGVRLLGLAQMLAILLGVMMGARSAGGRSRLLPALAVLISAGIVSTGPVFIAGSRSIANPLFLLTVEHLDVLRRWWWPGRAVAFVELAVVALGALGLDRLETRLGRRRALASSLLLLLCAAVVPARGGLLPLDAWPARVSPGIRCLAEGPAGAVVELPYKLGQRPLYHQTIHGRPILNGMLITKEAFAPPEAVVLRSENSFVRVLLALGERDWRRSRDPWSEADLQAFLDLGYRYVVFRKEGYLRPRPQRDATLKMESDWPRARRIIANVRPLGTPAWEDDEIAIYTLGGAPFSCGPGEDR